VLAKKDPKVKFSIFSLCNMCINNYNHYLTVKEEDEEQKYARELAGVQRDETPVPSNPYLQFYDQSMYEQYATKCNKKETDGFYDRASINFGCPKRYKVTTFMDDQRRPTKTIVYTIGEHNEKCAALASSGGIPQSLHPQLQEWIIKKLEDGSPVHVIQDIIDDQSSHAQNGCPIPSDTGPGSRYRPTDSTLRNLSSLAKVRRLLDKNESKGVDLIVEELKREGSLAFYNSGRCVCQVQTNSGW
jgi:hypothetical protein